MPYEVEYPVAFREGGDTTRDAFGKHIQEITRIYGILSVLDSNKMDSSTFTSRMEAHINSTNPHPNYQPSMGQITGTLDMSRVTGNLAASRIVGTLTNANIDSSKVNGLRSFVEGLIPEAQGDGITESDLSAEGSITFNNGLIVKWGVLKNLFIDATTKSHSYPVAFPNECFSVHLSYYNTTNSPSDDTWTQLVEFNKGSFACTRMADNNNTWAGNAGVTYLAIGK